MFSSAIERFMGFFAFLAAGLLFKMVIGKSGGKNKKEFQQFLDEEHEANFARAHKIPDEMFYHPDTGSLPDTDYGDGEEFKKLNQAKQKVISGSSSKMLRLNPPMKNIEIKQNFGAANLERITNYETSYDQYIRSLSNFAEELMKLGFFEDAKKILMICMEMDSLIFLPYSLLCDIYAKEKNAKAILELKDKVDSTEIIFNNKLLTGKIIDCINTKLKEIEN